MTRSVAELAAMVGARVEGNAQAAIHGVAPIDTAGPGQLTFLANPKYSDRLRTTRATAVIVAPPADGGSPRDLASAGVTLLEHDNPYFAFLKILTFFHPTPPPPTPGVDPTARIGHRVTLHDRVHVGSHCVVEDEAVLGEGTVILAGSFVGAYTKLGADCRIGPNATILRECTLGNRVRIHPGAVVGSDGFGYALSEGKHEKIPQVGGVTIGDDVEIGACCTIDRATMGQTVIGRGTKIDNLVQIAHNVQIGPDCLIIAQTGVSGSTKLGDHVTLAGQVGIVGHIEIGAGAIVAAQSGVGKSIPPGQTWLGTPAHDITHQRRVYAAVKSLPDTIRHIRELEKRIAELEGRLNTPRST